MAPKPKPEVPVDETPQQVYLEPIVIHLPDGPLPVVRPGTVGGRPSYDDPAGTSQHAITDAEVR